MSTRAPTRLAVPVVALLVASACADGAPSSGPSPRPPTPEAERNPAALVEGEPYAPVIDPENFVDVIDNPYLPLQPGTTLAYEGISEGERETTEVTVTQKTKVVMGVNTTVVRDQVFVDGELAEDTFDWYAQDRQGNVWYFGEDSREIENGKVVSTEGSWEAGVDGAKPGIVMLGEPRVGDAYRQEFYRGEAEDQARVLALGESMTVPYGSFDQVLVTEDRNPLEPRLLENKFYAPGVGVVLERLVRGGREILRLVEVKMGD
jgi:hypothetical protein